MADMNGVVILERGFLELVLETVSAWKAERVPSLRNIVLVSCVCLAEAHHSEDHLPYRALCFPESNELAW